MSRSTDSGRSRSLLIGSLASMVLGGILLAAGFLAAGLLAAAPIGVIFAGKLLLLAGGLVAAVAGFGVITARRQACESLLANLALAAASLLVTLVAAELAVRAVYRDIETTSNGRSYFSHNWQRTVRVNRLGFRDRDVAEIAADGTYRILVIGDSFTFGQGIDEETRFTNLIETMLDDAAGDDGRYEVVNLGRPGASTVDELDILTSTGLALDPDFIILQWCANDFEPKIGALAPPRIIPSDYLTDLLERHSALYAVARIEILSLYARLGVQPNYETMLCERTRDRSAPDVRRSLGALQQFIDRCARSEVPLAVVLFPLGSAGSRLTYLNDWVVETCHDAGVVAVDLEPVYAAAAGQPGMWANRFDHHPGPLASRLAAERLMQWFGPLWLGADGAGDGGTGGAGGRGAGAATDAMP